ncbi:MAG: energy-coupling factor transporter transmembrane protein EcfT [Actinomycetota bacterium]|nr:energy-coupling factor transporter transmembrane protein EcfT [Actinomycetota bacterium]
MIALYLPGRSILHRAPAGVKLIALMVIGLVISLYPHTLLSVGIVLVLVLALFLGAQLAPRVVVRQLWQTKWIVALMVISQLIFLTPPDAAINTVRVVSIVLLAGLLTLTTRSEDLLEALQRGLQPLARFGVDPRRVGLTLSLTISMLPVVAGIAARVREAQQARGVRVGYRIVVPMLVMALRHADDVADALSARGVE